MLEKLQELLKPELFAVFLVYLLATQALLSGLKKALDLIKDRTSSQVDNKLSQYLGYALSPLEKLVKLLQGNSNKNA